MDTMKQNLHIAWRQAARHPAYTAVVILILALGIGVNTAIFSVVDSVLLEPLPFDNGPRLVHLGFRPDDSEHPSQRFSVPEYMDLRTRSEALEEVAEYHSMAFTLLGGGEPTRVQTGVVSGNYFQMMGIRPAEGRLFGPADESPDADPPMVLTHEFWHRHFGGDPGVIGKTVTLAGHPMPIVGILPPLPDYPGENDVFVPTNGCHFRSQTRVAEGRALRFIHLFGRLEPGVSTEAAQAELNRNLTRMWQEYPDSRPETAGLGAVPVVSVREELIGNFRATLGALVGMVGLVLLIACANVANLSLARLINREREIAMRTTLGAGRLRLTGQLVTESTLLALVGGLAGFGLAVAGVHLLIPLVGRFTSRASEVTVDGNVLLFAFGVSLVAGLVVGLSQAIHRSDDDLAAGLKEGGGKTTATASKHRLRNLLGVLQVAVSCVLLIGAGLTFRSLLGLQQIDPGFTPQNVITGNLALSFNKYQSPPQFIELGRTVQERLGALPGVEAVAIGSDLPLDAQVNTPAIRIEGRPQEEGQPQPQAIFTIASESYFDVAGVPIHQGRAFRASDDATADPVVIVNQALVERFWPGQDPLGRRLAVGPGSWRTVVGVAGNVRQRSLAEADPGPAIYLPFLQQPTPVMQLFVATERDPELLVGDVRRTIREIDPELPVAELQTLEQVYKSSLAQPRLTALLFGIFAGLAFVITALGIGGLVAFSVSQRLQEIGIRSALGARKSDVVRLVVGQGLLLVVVGLAVGIVGASYTTRILDSLLYGVTATDPGTFVMASVLLFLVSGIACLLPVRRALRIDPVRALRTE